MAKIRNKKFTIPYDFFNRNEIILVNNFGDDCLVLYIRLLTMTLGGDGSIEKHEFGIKNEDIYDVISIISGIKKERIVECVLFLESLHLVKIFEDGDLYIAQLNEGRVRDSKNVAKWRTDVFKRDNYTCQKCGIRGVELNAHHIVRWADSYDLRYELSNGITLCKECHKIEHGWRTK